MLPSDHQLFPYQRAGVDFLRGRKVALLADEMGLGKTPQSVVACDEVGANGILVVCPAVARFNWRREFERFSKRERPIVVIERRDDQPQLGGVTIASYDLVSAMAHTWVGEWDALILDEIHYCKSIDAKRSSAILGKAGLVHRTKHTWALSGTPAPNHAGELWPLLRVFGATSLSYDHFISRYCESYDSGYGIKISGTKKLMIPELRELLGKIMLRRRKSEVLKDLPPISFHTVVVEAGEVDVGFEVARLRGEAALLAQAMALRELDPPSAMMTLEGLAQSLSTLRRYKGLQKVEAVAQMVNEELELGLYDKIVVFAIHRDVIARLAARWAKWRPVVVTGSTSPEDRQRAVDRFQQNPQAAPHIFIGNIQAAGTNLTLTAAHHVLFVEEDWVPGNNQQAAMRCHRIGQTSPVTVRMITLNHPLDERISEIVRKKTSELTEIFDFGY